jgi:hypothetical protein
VKDTLPDLGGDESVHQRVVRIVHRNAIVGGNGRQIERGANVVVTIAKCFLKHEPVKGLCGVERRQAERTADRTQFLVENMRVDADEVTDQHAVLHKGTKIIQYGIGRVTLGNIFGAQSVHDDALGRDVHPGVHDTIELFADKNTRTVHGDRADGKQTVRALIERGEFGVENDKADIPQSRAARHRRAGETVANSAEQVHALTACAATPMIQISIVRVIARA